MSAHSGLQVGAGSRIWRHSGAHLEPLARATCRHHVVIKRKKLPEKLHFWIIVDLSFFRGISEYWRSYARANSVQMSANARRVRCRVRTKNRARRYGSRRQGEMSGKINYYVLFYSTDGEELFCERPVSMYCSTKCLRRGCIKDAIYLPDTGSVDWLKVSPTE